MIAAERRVVHRRFALFGGKAGEQCRIRMELFRAAVQLLRAGQIYQGALVYVVYGAAELDILAAQCTQIADIARIFRQAGNGEAAVLVFRLGAAAVKEACAVAKLNDVIDVRGKTDIFANVVTGFRCRMACPRMSSCGDHSGKRKQQQCGSRTHAARLCRLPNTDDPTLVEASTGALMRWLTATDTVRWRAGCRGFAARGRCTWSDRRVS